MLHTNKKKTTTTSIHRNNLRDALVYTDGIDTYINPGRPVKTLALAQNKRDTFFKQHHHIAELLQRELTNPILEEGQQTAHTRSRIGEYYLTYDALMVLITCHLKKQPETYNTENTFLVKNEPSKLTFLLHQIDFTTADAKFIYIDHIHAIAGYVGQYQQQLYCFIVDPEGSNNRSPTVIIDAVQDAIPNAQIVISTTILQKDYFSCSTIAYQLLRYFCRHGREIAPYLQRVIDKQNTLPQSSYLYQMVMFIWHQGNDLFSYLISLINLAPPPSLIFKLPAHQLMPVLLKLCQSNMTLSDDILTTIVSQKRQVTLQDYLQQHQVLTPHGHALNSTAIEKRYCYFSKIDDYLAQQKSVNKSLKPQVNFSQ